MKRLILAALLAIFFPAVLASQQLTGTQGEDAQKKLDSFLLGKRLVAKIAFPGYKTGIDLKTDGTWDQRWATRMIKEHGVGIEVGDSAAVTAVKLKGNHIEIHLNGGGFGTAGDVLLTSDATRQGRGGCGGKGPGGSGINLRVDHSISGADAHDLARLTGI